jgi:Flp pilus assembly protein TadG
LWRLLGDARGATAIMTALAATTLMGFAGLAVDVGFWHSTQHRMQGVADEAAFAAAMAQAKGESDSTATTAVAHDLGFADDTNSVTVTVNNPPSSGSHSTDNNAYEVIISQPQPMWFAGFFLSSDPTVTVRAVASPNPVTGPACVMALKTTGQDAAIASGSAVVDLSTCDIVDDSSDPKALEATGGSSIKALDAYIVGNYNGNLTVSGTLKTGSSVIPDPYANRTAPTVGACGSNPTSSSGGGYNGNCSNNITTTIYPGVYCGDITPGAPLTMSPGSTSSRVEVSKTRADTAPCRVGSVPGPGAISTRPAASQSIWCRTAARPATSR